MTKKWGQQYSNQTKHFKTKAIKKGKEIHYKMTKESKHKADITFINIFTTNIGTDKYIKQRLRHKGRN